MKLILTADVDNLGAPGDTVEVKDGYGRNYLLPRGLAIVATRGAEKQVEGIRRSQEAKRVRGLDHANELKQAIEGLESVSLTVKTAESGKLFGSVTAADVARSLGLSRATVGFVLNDTPGQTIPAATRESRGRSTTASRSKTSSTTSCAS